MRTSLLLLIVAFGLVLSGFVLVLAGLGVSGSSGGCFLWPFPIIVVCGAGVGGASDVFLVIGLFAVAVVSLLSFLLMRRALAH